MDVSRILQDARAKKNLSQRELAKLLKVSYGAVAQWETGATKPSISNRADISRVLNIPFSQLVPETRLSGDFEIDNPELLSIAQQLLKLTPEIREAVLMVALQTVESQQKRGRKPA